MIQELPTITFIHTLADIAGKEALRRFRSDQPMEVSSKSKRGMPFDPVTEADQETERVMRDHILSRYPYHAISGEEFGLTGGGPIQWQLDPINGTRAFLCGLPVWGTLIGLLHNGRAKMGMMTQPFTRERFWADGKMAWRRGLNSNGMLMTRKNIPLNQAILHTNSPELIDHNAYLRFKELSKLSLMTRYGGECYAMAMLAAGHIDICVEYALKPYDIVAFIPIIEQAGGVVTTLKGERPEAGGQILAAGCARIHEQALKILNG